MKLNAEQIKEGLSGFFGTEAYHQWSPLFPAVLTDGAKYLADSCGAYWLMDLAASHHAAFTEIDCDSVMIDLKNEDGEWSVTLKDMRTEKIVAFQKIEYTDFPLLEGIHLYMMRQDNFWVILLPSEY